MIRRYFPFSLFLLLVLAACASRSTVAPSSEETPTAPVETTMKFTQTKIYQTATFTEHPTKTVTNTQTQSPIPTLQTTFDAALVVTRTPSPPAKCPKDDPSVVIPLDLFEMTGQEFETAALAFLDAGGINQLLNKYDCQPTSSCVKKWIANKDLTGDGIPELVWRGGGNILQELYVFGCNQGRYVTLLVEESAHEYAPTIIAVKDMNLNSVNELAVEQIYCGWCFGARIFEWNGIRLESMVSQGLRPYPYFDYGDLAGLDGRTTIEVIDTDGDGTLELVLQGGSPSFMSGISGSEGPYREQEVIYAWDGSHFTWLSQQYEPPRFRFEAVLDGDTATERGDLDRALAFYQDAIFSDQLASWTPEIWYEIAKDPTRKCCSPPDINAMPFNSVEYAQLAAYSRYRIMILHAYRGWENDAQIVYDTLMSKFSPGDPGYPYTQMATEFWSEFIASHDLAAACGMATKYAARHEEILIPLGNNEHGMFVEHHKAETVCPWD